jgi:hypothetical protein
MTKVCRECGQELPLTDFYKHSEMADGHLNKCKRCVRNRVSKHRSEHLDRIREYDRERGKLEHRMKQKTEITRRRRGEVKGYNAAHLAVSRALAKGELIKPERCQICTREARLEAHHADYSKPLEVLWVCVVCHRNIHKNIKRIAKIS